MSADYAQLQTDIRDKLLSEELLANVAVKALRDVQSIQPGGESADDISAIQAAIQVWAVGRNNKIGVGIIVGMPVIKFVNPNVPGGERTLEISISICEEPLTNTHGANKVGLAAETVSDYVAALLHQFAIDGLCSLYAQKQEPNTELPGIVRYDVTLRGTLPREDIDPVIQPSISEAAGTVTLTNNTSGATIYYTTDGTFPGSGNSAAVQYSAPFAASVGTVIRWAAYKTGMRGSDVGQTTVT